MTGKKLTGNTPSAALTSEAVPDNFEQALTELEQIVAAMETGDMTLEASLVAYSRAVMLTRACQTQLQAAEQHVKVLEQDLLRPFEGLTSVETS